MTVTDSETLPYVLCAVRVARATRLSPGFVRVEFTGPGLAEVGVHGPTYDVRIKLVFPGASGLPSLPADESWYAAWAALPERDRGHLRTYTVRELRGAGAGAVLVVDFAVHGSGEGSGPGSDWAERARPGDEVLLVAPRRGVEYHGIEFAPGAASELLLIADETAVPAVASILEQLPDDARGAAFLEVASAADRQALIAPRGVQVTWLVRDGGPWGCRLVPVVRRHLGLDARSEPVVRPDPTEPEVWETPTYSADGDALPARVAGTSSYAWIAGESGVVRALRRALVGELGWDRAQVAFMGYWRRGVAMRS